jgi:hypothetical protein
MNQCCRHVRSRSAAIQRAWASCQEAEGVETAGMEAGAVKNQHLQPFGFTFLQTYLGATGHWTLV